MVRSEMLIMTNIEHLCLFQITQISWWLSIAVQ